MADDKDKVGGASSDNTSASTDRSGADRGGAGINSPAADRADTSAADPLAYRDKGDNGKRRAEHMERLLIDNFFGGNLRRYDEAAGLDFDAK